VQAVPELARILMRPDGQAGFAWGQWFALTAAGAAVGDLPAAPVPDHGGGERRRAPPAPRRLGVSALPAADQPVRAAHRLGGLLLFGAGRMDPEAFVLSLPLAQGQPALALLAFVGGLSAATGMVIVEAIAVSGMVCNDLVMPLLLRTRRFGTAAAGGDLTRVLLGIRRGAIVLVLLLGYVYFHLAGEAYALVSIGLISFAAVAQFAPAMLGGMYWRGGTRIGALAGLLAGFALWAYTLMLPSIAKSGWLLSPTFLQQGPVGHNLAAPGAAAGPARAGQPDAFAVLEPGVNLCAYVGVVAPRTLGGRRPARPAVRGRVRAHPGSGQRDAPVFWRGKARWRTCWLLERFLGAPPAHPSVQDYARARGLEDAQRLIRPTRNWCSSSRPSWPGPSAARRPVPWWPRWCRRTRWCSTTCCRSWTRPRSCAPTRALEEKSARSKRGPPRSCAPPTSSSRAWTG
jgi:hypothetical protein